MRIVILLLLLAGCATPAPKPDRAKFMFQCENGILWAASLPEGWDGGYMAEVGHCIGELKIIGPRRSVTRIGNT